MLVPRVANFKGYISQLTFNGLDYFDRMRTGLLTKDFEMTASFSQVDDVIFHDVTFKNQMTYLGLPQLRAYYDISISFRFKTLEMGGKFAKLAISRIIFLKNIFLFLTNIYTSAFLQMITTTFYLFSFRSYNVQCWKTPRFRRH